MTLGEIFGYIPTIRKSWNKPYSETLVFYEITSFRHGFSILALEKLNLLTALYPATWALVNVTIAIILILRRRKIRKNSDKSLHFIPHPQQASSERILPPNRI